MKKFLFFLSLLVFTFFVESSFSEEQKELQKIVVTATKVPTPLEHLGASAEIITRDDIEKSQTTDVVDLLRNVPSLIVPQTGSRGSTASLFVRGGESDYNLIMIDGVQINQSAGAFDFSNLTTENIERIEIIKGAHSAIYGSDALTSVINIITKKGRGKATLSVSGALGVRKEDKNLIQEYEASASAGNEQYGYFLSFGRSSDEGILDLNNEHTNNTYTGTFNLIPHEKLDFSVTTVYQDSKFEFPTGSAGDRFDVLDPDNFSQNDTLVIGANISYRVLPWWENTVSLGLTNQERKNKDKDNGMEIDPFGGSESKVEEKRQMVDYRSNIFFNNNNLSSVTTLGFEYEKEKYDGFGLKNSRNNYAYYAQNQLGLYESLFITAGIRLDNNENYGTELTPRASLSYLIKDSGTKLRSSVGKGIKEPSFFENFAEGFTTGNPDLKPEESLNIEGGIDQLLFNDTLKLYFTCFWNKFENLIQYSAEPFANETNYANVQETETKGIEVGGSFNASSEITLGLNYVYLDTEVTEDGGLGSAGFSQGSELIRRPSHYFSFVTNYLYKDFNLNVSGTYIGKRDDLNFAEFPSKRVENGSYFKADLAASYKIPLDFPYLQGATVFTRAENLFNKDYEDVFGFSSPGLSILTGLSVSI